MQSQSRYCHSNGEYVRLRVNDNAAHFNLGRCVDGILLLQTYIHSAINLFHLSVLQVYLLNPNSCCSSHEVNQNYEVLPPAAASVELGGLFFFSLAKSLGRNQYKDR
jgi:hypothetical protein